MPFNSEFELGELGSAAALPGHLLHLRQEGGGLLQGSNSSWFRLKCFKNRFAGSPRLIQTHSKPTPRFRRPQSSTGQKDLVQYGRDYGFDHDTWCVPSDIMIHDDFDF